MQHKLSNKIHLITYPDSLGNNLKDLYFVLDKYFKGYIHGVHILPFFPSSSDRGFSPLTYFQIDPKFGDWKDIKKIADEYEVACDLMVNHISSQSRYFKDYLAKGENSEYADWFITTEKFAHNIQGNLRKKIEGKFLYKIERIMNKIRHYDIFLHRDGVSLFDLRKIYRPREGSPFVKFQFKDGSSKKLWCTFSHDQVDLDINNPDVKNFFKMAIKNFQKNNIRLLRLDAVGYTGKKKGTSNFLIKETYKFITWISNICHGCNIEILPEVHFDYKAQIKLAETKGVDYSYDFTLPFVVLYALYKGEAKYLSKWLSIRPQNMINVLDNHDGISVVEAKKIVKNKDISFVINKLTSYGANPLDRSSGINSKRTEPYQRNITFYSAFGENDDAYITSRVIQFFAPGIPQVYYVGLLAGKNDQKLYAKTQIGRDVNRHPYSIKEIEKNLNRKVVKRLLKLIDFRNSYPAFSGNFNFYTNNKHTIYLAWKKDGLYCDARINLRTKKSKIQYIDPKTNEKAAYMP